MSLSSAYQIILFPTSGKQRDSGVLARATVRVPQLDLSIRGVDIWKGTDDRGPYCNTPARKYTDASGRVQFFRYLDGSASQVIREAVMAAFWASPLSKDFREFAPSAPMRNAHQAAAASADSDDDIPF